MSVSDSMNTLYRGRNIYVVFSGNKCVRGDMMRVKLGTDVRP